MYNILIVDDVYLEPVPSPVMPAPPVAPVPPVPSLGERVSGDGAVSEEPTYSEVKPLPPIQ